MEPSTLGDRISAVRERIRQATVVAGRAPGSVELLLATKTVGPGEILQAISAGCGLIGENRVQELRDKAEALSGAPHSTHFIGHLQANKVNQLLGHIDCLQTLDSLALARRVQARLVALDSRLDVLIEVNVSGEPSKAGVGLDTVPDLLARLTELDRLTVRGYLTVGLNSPDLAQVGAGFAALASFAHRARESGLPGAERADQLSMGMSGDFETAIAHGATIVRLGSAIFGPRRG